MENEQGKMLYFVCFQLQLNKNENENEWTEAELVTFLLSKLTRMLHKIVD